MKYTYNISVSNIKIYPLEEVEGKAEDIINNNI